MTHDDPRKNVRTLGLLLHFGGLFAVTLVILLVLTCVVFPLRRKGEAFQRQITELHAQQREAPALRDERASLQRSVLLARNRIDVLLDGVPGQTDDAEIFARISALAEGATVRVRQFQPSPIMQREEYSELAVRFAGEGSYEGLCRFLQSIDTHLRHAVVIGLQLNSSGVEGRCQIEMDLVVYFNEGQTITSEDQGAPREQA